MKKVIALLTLLILIACAAKPAPEPTPQPAPVQQIEIVMPEPTMPQKPLYEPPPSAPTEDVVQNSS